jgi:hypothetical protein
LWCYKEVHDSASALQLYCDAQQRNKSLTNAQTLQTVLTMVRYTQPLVNMGIELYRNALKDSAQFPKLKSDPITAKAAISLYLNAPKDSQHTLKEAIKIKTMLKQEGTRIDSAIYATLMAVAARHRDLATELEAALLHVAVRAGAREESMEIFNRIRASEELGLSVAVVESMLEGCRESADAALATQLLLQWTRGGGALSWPMCHAITQLLLTPEVLKAVAQEDANSAAASTGTKSSGDAEGAKLTPQQVQEKKGRAKLVQMVLKRAVDGLHAFQRRSGGESKQGAPESGRALKNNDILASVPLYVLPALGALLALRGESEVLFTRLDSTTGVKSGQQHRADHQQVVLRTARDLALLGRWRYAMALSSRVGTYKHNDDVLSYPQEALTAVRHYTLLALIRSGEYDRANMHIDAHMSPSTPAVVEAMRATLEQQTPGSSALFAAEIEYIAGRLAVSGGSVNAV